MIAPLKIYCEHNALTPQIRRLRHLGRIEVLHFPYDRDSTFRQVSRQALPSDAQVRDLQCTIDELGDVRIGDFVGSEHLEAIVRIVGLTNRRDALHVDSAYRSGCQCIVTGDSDIWSKASELELLLGLRVFRPDDPALVEFLSG